MQKHVPNWPLRLPKPNHLASDTTMEKDKAELYRAEKLNDLLLFKANYKHFRFQRHAHEDYALGLMEKGIQKFHCRGEDRSAPPGSLITVNAGDIHDGMSADGNDYRYRIIYIPVDLMDTIAKEMVGRKKVQGFRSPVTLDRIQAKRLASIFSLLDCATCDPLEIQSLFYTTLAVLLARHGAEGGQTLDCCKEGVPESVERACVFINDMAREDISLDDIAGAAGLSRYHFLRVFSSSQGITPHSYLLQRRLQLARESLRSGVSIADAAYDARFADQSHFSRRFKTAYGITPKQYQRAVS